MEEEDKVAKQSGEVKVHALDKVSMKGRMIMIASYFTGGCNTTRRLIKLASSRGHAPLNFLKNGMSETVFSFSFEGSML